MAKLLNKVKVDKSRDENSFQSAVAPVITIAQINGLLPITGVFSRNIQNVKFQFLSLRTLHAAAWLISATIFLGLEISRMSKYEAFNAKTIGGITFYCAGILSSIFFFRIASKWNELLYLFKEIEDIFHKNSYTLSGWSLKKRINIAAISMLIFGLPEHLLSWYSYINDRVKQVEICDWKIDSWFYYITTLHLGQVYQVFSVNTFTVLWAEYMNLSFAFAWNFIDLFIIIMSISVATKFKMLNERLNSFKGRIVADTLWDDVRCHYNKLCELNEFIDALLGNLICTACLSDLYSVCMQLLNVATPLPFLANKVYFWYSMIFLIARTFSMFLISASINDESIKPLAVFRTIPRNGWCQDVQRFSNQIHQSGVALSGKNFFSLTRGILISVAGTIITYELVLLQFDGEKIVSGMFNPDCGNGSYE